MKQKNDYYYCGNSNQMRLLILILVMLAVFFGVCVAIVYRDIQAFRATLRERAAASESVVSYYDNSGVATSISLVTNLMNAISEGMRAAAPSNEVSK